MKQDPLDRYREMRNFAGTPEPRGAAVPRRVRGLRYYIQKHAARALHYDFRLELDGVLRSWAVPKGPSLRAGDKRLAVEVEDHPLEYGSFEGTIPEGHYGAGRVELWDQGIWTPEGNPDAGLARGRLTFRLEGRRLNGVWSLVRMRPDGKGKKTNWLLIRSDRKPTAAAPAISKAKRVGLAPPDAEATPPTTVAGVVISHPDRLIYPAQRLTKLDVARYYERVAERMLPYVADRPLTLVRCPDGLAAACFYQKNWSGREDAVRVVRIAQKTGTNSAPVVSDARGLVSLIQNGALEIHPWGSRSRTVEKPDVCVFDLDPSPELPWPDVAAAARSLRERLRSFDLESFLKTTGGKGLHVVVPFTRSPGWEDLVSFARLLASELAREDPDRYLTTASKQARRGRIFVDWLRNGRGATAVAPYSTRAREQATVAAPLSWDELDGLGRADAITVSGIGSRLDRDPWRGYFAVKQKLPRMKPRS